MNTFIINNLFSGYDVLIMMFNVGGYIVNDVMKEKELYLIFSMMYGNTIVFSKRSLKMSKKLYLKYRKHGLVYNTSYIVMYTLLKKNYDLYKDSILLENIIKNNLNNRESIYYINYGKIKKIEPDFDSPLEEIKNIWINAE